MKSTKNLINYYQRRLRLSPLPFSLFAKITCALMRNGKLVGLSSRVKSEGRRFEAYTVSFAFYQITYKGAEEKWMRDYSSNAMLQLFYLA